MNEKIIFEIIQSNIRSHFYHLNIFIVYTIFEQEFTVIL